MRKAFEAAAGNLLLAADYSQIELRILAHIVREEPLLEAFRQGQDIHAVTASRLFDAPLDQVSYEQRSLGKMINFATIYGVSAFGLSSRTEMGPTEAQAFLDQYFATYPKVRQYIDDTIQQAHTDGYVETLLGRKRYFRELQERLPFNQRQALEPTGDKRADTGHSRGYYQDRHEPPAQALAGRWLTSEDAFAGPRRTGA